MTWGIFFAFFTFFGFNFTFWSLVSGTRYVFEKWRPPANLTISPAVGPQEVAVLIAARNEELALPRTLASLQQIVSPKQIYIGSDDSSDQTVAIARSFGCQVLDLHPNRGKPKMLLALLKHFRILQRYRAVLFLDADVIVDKNFLRLALPFFNNPKNVAVAGHAISAWTPHWRPRWSMFFTAYRIRLWRVLQYAIRYGQTWQFLNLTTIAPGGSSLYRTSILHQIAIDTPGMTIEDFHMTFQIHYKRLGKIAYHPNIFVIDQEPYRLRDYIRQVRRWNLGFWQTFLEHGVWLNSFWVFTTAFAVELIVYSLFIITVPWIIFLFIQNSFEPLSLHWMWFGGAQLSWLEFVLGLFVTDYLITALVSAIERKPVLLLYGLGFSLLRYVDAAIFLITFPMALIPSKKGGQWVSPQRR